MHLALAWSSLLYAGMLMVSILCRKNFKGSKGSGDAGEKKAGQGRQREAAAKEAAEEEAEVTDGDEL